MALLTVEQWRKVSGKFSWMRVHREFTDIHLEILGKWMSAHCHGWYYIAKEAKDDTVIMFEHQSEMVHCRLWLYDDPFSSDHGEVT